MFLVYSQKIFEIFVFLNKVLLAWYRYCETHKKCDHFIDITNISEVSYFHHKNMGRVY